MKARKRRNAVSARFSFVIWLSESLILFSFGSRRQWEGVYLVLYLVLDSCFTPVLYYVGIESNRERMRNFLSDTAVMMVLFVEKMTCRNKKVVPVDADSEEVQEVGQMEVQE